MKIPSSLNNFRMKVLLSFIIFAAIFFTIDWLLKHFIFNSDDVDWDNNGYYYEGTEKNYGIIGFRSVAHDNSTIFSAFRIRMPDWAHFIINFTIASIFVVIPFFTKSLFLGIACGIVLAGVLGNSFDKVISTQNDYYARLGGKSYVRDILYIPWFDRGTFNFADVAIISGSILLVIYVIITNVQDWKKNKATKNLAK